MQRLWEIESDFVFKPKTGKSAEDRAAVSILENSLKEREDGHFELSLLFREPNPNFPNNRSYAERMLKRNKVRFMKKPEYLEMYQKQVQQYIDNGFARIVPSDEAPPEKGKTWYLVHHGVSHERKPGKIRVVFNCSGEFKGVCLNQKLYCGPDLINLLIGVLIRCRTGRFAACADITAMYHQVFVPTDQTSYLRWLWFKDSNPNAEVIELEMLVHLFGCLSSSCCANFALRQCALEFPENSHEREQILRSFYVDDYLTSFEDLDIAAKVMAEVFNGLKGHGFVLNKFCASKSEVLKGIPSEKVAQSDKSLEVKEIRSHEVSEQCALGVRWDPVSDNFIFEINEMSIVCSKRGVLSAIARILYDPCGIIISVLILPARLLFQELCRRCAQWDEPLTDQEEQLFRRWYSDLVSMPSIHIARCVHPLEFSVVERRELHYFSDASEKCYGTACYLREIDAEGRVSCVLVFAKSRLAPLRRTLTLVRLELQAAAASVMARNLIEPELNVSLDARYFWTDSMPVLGYINNDQKRYQVYTANRVALIRASSEPSEWHWLPSEQNCADLVTRGIRDVKNFDGGHVWFTGPDFLQSREWNFPSTESQVPVPADDDPEVRRNQSIFTTENGDSRPPTFTEIFLVKFRNLYSMKFGVAVMRKFMSYLQSGSKPSKVVLSDLQQAEKIIIKIAQREKYGDLVKLLTDSQDATVPKDCTIRKLKPFVHEEDGLLRIGGKLANFPGNYDFRHPLILSNCHHVTECIIREYHTSFGHSSVMQILNELRMRFHVVGGRSTVRPVWSKCLSCRRYISQPMDQYMNDLPPSRLKPFEPAFSYCSVDLFGHLYVKVKRSNVKRWGVVFVCDSSKAVHLEIVHSLTMSSFMEALLRMARRRTWPKQIRSDQGSNLRAADREICQAVTNWNNSGIEDRLRQRNIEWKFTPPTGSHMNGLAERTIRSARNILVHLLTEQTISDEGLATVFVECEYILNNRPIVEFNQVGHSILTLQVKGTESFLIVMKNKASCDKLAAMAPSVTINSIKFHAEFGSPDILELRPRTKVVIYDAPLSVTDEQLIQLLHPYGDTIDGKVYWERYPPPFNHIQSGTRFAFMKNIKPKEGLPLSVDFKGSLIKFRHPKQIKDPAVRAQIQAGMDVQEFPEQSLTGPRYQKPRDREGQTTEDAPAQNDPQDAQMQEGTNPPTEPAIPQNQPEPEPEPEDRDKASAKETPPPPMSGTPWENSDGTTAQMNLSVSSYEQAPSPKTASRQLQHYVAKQSKLRQATLFNQNRFWALGNPINADPENGCPEPDVTSESRSVTSESRSKKEQSEKSKKNKKKTVKNQAPQPQKIGKTTPKSPKALTQLAAIAISKVMENDQLINSPGYLITEETSPPPVPDDNTNRVGELSQIIIQAAADLALDTYTPLQPHDVRSSSPNHPTKASSHDDVAKPVGGQEPNSKRNGKRHLTPETKPPKRLDDKTTPDRIEDDEFNPFNSDDSYY